MFRLVALVDFLLFLDLFKKKSELILDLRASISPLDILEKRRLPEASKSPRSFRFHKDYRLENLVNNLIFVVILKHFHNDIFP